MQNFLQRILDISTKIVYNAGPFVIGLMLLGIGTALSLGVLHMLGVATKPAVDILMAVAVVGGMVMGGFAALFLVILGLGLMVASILGKFSW